MSKNLFDKYSINKKKTLPIERKRKDKPDDSSIETETETEPDYLVENEKKEEDKETFTPSELRLLSDRYNVAVTDVINFLDSIEGKKSIKLDYLRSHFDNKQKDREIERLKNLVSLDLLPISKVTETNNDNNGYDADIKYQRQVAAAWGPFLMMRNLSPAQNDDAIKREIEELKESNKDLKNLLYSFLSGNQGKPKNDDPIDNMTRFLGLFKGIKDVLSESEAERQKKIEEETKQKEIEANKEKVSKLIEAIQNYSPNSEPESKFEPSVPVYRAVNNNNIDRPVKVLNKKFKDKFSKN